MASKIAAIFLRGTRGCGDALYHEKGRDIYDLLWYMEKKIVPDFDYLIAKGIDVKDFRALFDKMTIRMNTVNDRNLKQDLTPLFVNGSFIEGWLQNWRESYLHLLDAYKIRTVTQPIHVYITVDSRSNNLSFAYVYATEEGPEVHIEYRLSDFWLVFDEGGLNIPVDDHVVRLMTQEAQKKTGKKAMRQKQYATLFYQKTETYFKKTNKVIIGDNMATKLIRMTSDHLNRNEQIVLTKSALLSSELELDDLLE